MKKNFLSLVMMFLISFMSFSTVFAHTEEDFIGQTPVMSEEADEFYETFKDSRSCHDSYKALVDAMMKVKDQGGFTKAEIKAIHKFYEGQVSSNAKLPSDSKGLLDLLYSNNIITKAQYDQTLSALQ